MPGLVLERRAAGVLHAVRWPARLVAVALVLWGGVAASRAGKKAREAPRSLSATGLYSDIAQHVVSSSHLEYAPQYPLWTDGAAKRRWISLPPGSFIDGAKPDAWKFPTGTKFWKEFSFGGKRIETRYMERLANGTWLYASYAWTEDERDAVLVGAGGQRRAFEVSTGTFHDIPGVTDCKICHQGQRTEVLGFGALQLSPDRDPEALHADAPPAPGVNNPWLVKRGLLKRFPRELLDRPPRIAAATPTERAALGYLHGNCGHCHNSEGALAGLEFSLRHAVGGGPQAPEPALRTAVGQRVRARASGQTQDAVLRVDPGHPETSVVLQRMGSRYAALQMPPLGSVILDNAALALLSRWIALGPSPAPEGAPAAGTSAVSP